jgi:hypothetical protein
MNTTARPSRVTAAATSALGNRPSAVRLTGMDCGSSAFSSTTQPKPRGFSPPSRLTQGAGSPSASSSVPHGVAAPPDTASTPRSAAPVSSACGPDARHSVAAVSRRAW